MVEEIEKSPLVPEVLLRMARRAPVESVMTDALTPNVAVLAFMAAARSFKVLTPVVPPVEKEADAVVAPVPEVNVKDVAGMAAIALDAGSEYQAPVWAVLMTLTR